MNEWLPRFGVRRPVTVLSLFVSLLVLGVIALARIPLTMLPEGFEPKVLWVRVPFPDASPAETDDLVVRPITEQLSTLSGLSELRSRAFQDSAGFSLEFHPSVDMDDAYNDVVDRMERAMPDLPSEIERYWVFKYNPSDEPILWAGVTFPDAVEDPYELMERVVRPRLERINGVASMDAWGLQGRAIYIDWDRDALLSHGVDLGAVQSSLARDNFQRTGGRLTDGGLVRHVRSLARIDGPEALERYPIQRGALALADVAEVSYRRLADADIDRVNGERSAAFGVRKESTGNTVAVGRALQAALDELEADPRTQGAKFFLFFSQGEQIEEATNNLGRALIEGGVLSVVVLWLFLRAWRITLLIATAIPLSMLLTLTVLYLQGSSLNLVAMMGLMLAVGNVVDNAIVVVEAIYQERSRGGPAADAAIRGAGKIALAILASTGTSMVVFLPVILMSEDAEASFFLRELGLPVIYAHAASLLVALILAPLATTMVGEAEVRPDPAWLVWLSERYHRLLGWLARRRSDATMSMAGMALLTVLVAVPGVQCTGEAEGGLNDFDISFTVPRDATHDDRDQLAHEFETLLEAHRDEWKIRAYRVEIGMHDTHGTAWVYLDDGAPPKDEVVEACKALLPTELPGVVARIGWGQGGGDDQLRVPVFGEDMATLTALGEEIARRARSVDGVLSAELETEQDGLEELVLRPDRDALRRYGLDARQVATTVAFALRGNSALPPIVQGEHEIDVVSRLSDDDRADIATLLDFPLFSGVTGRVVPVRAVVDHTLARGPGAIRRKDRRTSVDVVIDLARGTSAAETGPRVEAAMADLQLPRGYSVDHDAWQRDQDKTDEATLFALGMSVVFVYLLMGMLFESWLLPISILTAVPMALLGAFWGLFLTGTSMDLMAGIGLVVLVGVVVANGIVLVDRIDQARAEGMTREAAIDDACRSRLRPILMTALTTILGLIPMAVGSSDFIGIPYAPLGRCVMGGMIASTVLTLIYLPFLYTVLDDLAIWARGWWGVVMGRTA
ncbi:MAG TPA: efflux RND transporter permease subunit [Myxococcota bacterium]|nr:efflux RND transporter permease subunit [Myxococcota bacterium]